MQQHQIQTAPAPTASSTHARTCMHRSVGSDTHAKMEKSNSDT